MKIACNVVSHPPLSRMQRGQPSAIITLPCSVMQRGQPSAIITLPCGVMQGNKQYAVGAPVTFLFNLDFYIFGSISLPWEEGRKEGRKERKKARRL